MKNVLMHDREKKKHRSNLYKWDVYHEAVDGSEPDPRVVVGRFL